MYKVRFELNGEPMGTGVMPKRLYKVEYGPPPNIGFFCPQPECGHVWFRMFVEGGNPWVLWHVRCEKHKSFGPRAYNLPGSVWLDWDKDYQDSLSDALVRREFDLHLAHYLEWEKDIVSESILERI